MPTIIQNVFVLFGTEFDSRVKRDGKRNGKFSAFCRWMLSNNNNNNVCPLSISFHFFLCCYLSGLREQFIILFQANVFNFPGHLWCVKPFWADIANIILLWIMECMFFTFFSCSFEIETHIKLPSAELERSLNKMMNGQWAIVYLKQFELHKFRSNFNNIQLFNIIRILMQCYKCSKKFFIWSKIFQWLSWYSTAHSIWIIAISIGWDKYWISNFGLYQSRIFALYWKSHALHREKLGGENPQMAMRHGGKRVESERSIGCHRIWLQEKHCCVWQWKCYSQCQWQWQWFHCSLNAIPYGKIPHSQPGGYFGI